jgi:hypothetical protein
MSYNNEGATKLRVKAGSDACDWVEAKKKVLGGELTLVVTSISAGLKTTAFMCEVCEAG